jgi:hypothetical protein
VVAAINNDEDELLLFHLDREQISQTYCLLRASPDLVVHMAYDPNLVFDTEYVVMEKECSEDGQSLVRKKKKLKTLREEIVDLEKEVAKDEL